MPSLAGASASEDVWFAEGDTPGELDGPMLSADPAPESPRAECDGQEGELPDIMSVEGVQDIPIPRRFEHLAPRGGRHAPTSTKDVEYEGIVDRGQRVNLDALPPHPAASGPLRGEGDELLPEPRGGYTLVDLADSNVAARGMPEGMQHYVSVAPRALEGVQQHALAPTRKRLDPEVLDGLWRRDDAGHSRELGFLDRIPFDSGVGSSGGALPPGRLPRGKILDEAQPIVPAPRARSRAIPMTDDALSAAAAPRDEELALDADLAERALALDEQRHARRAEYAAAPAPAPEDERDALALARLRERRETSDPPEQSGARQGGARQGGATIHEERELVNSTSAVDFGTLSHPQRLDHIGEVRIEADVALRQGFKLPRDESMRRPLGEAADDGDPLGAAAPGIDIDDVKAEVSAQLETQEPVQRSFPTFGARSIAERRSAPVPQPGNAERPASTVGPRQPRGLPAGLARLRRARSADLSDLMRPQGGGGGGGGGGMRALGRLRHPGAKTPPKGGVRKQENAALAMQQLLHRHLKSRASQRFPQAGPGQRPRAGTRRF
eukprot:NODE_2407_length_2218_cov_1.915352.p1 GENE.NODE_2407_length_2218_cov_1.915352~~NODE_2407_length_2218_cov_1.915352.p1  ORF type:complete len:554 (+),score=186.31 NODE_2407_length_2218_cov_1.915352:344-2005(+)